MYTVAGSFGLEYAHCKLPRVKCPKCGAAQISGPFERKDSRFTTCFEGGSAMICLVTGKLNLAAPNPFRRFR